MSNIPRYSTIQKILNRAFYGSKKSITIFTEDKPSDKVFYQLFLNRLCSGKVKINKVVPLGNKQTVIENSILSKNSKNSSIFIVDSDIKLLLGHRLETENLISLDRYCIENYLICEDGVVEYLYLKLGEDKAKIKEKLKFEQFFLSNGKLILKLYYRLAVSYELSCGCSFKHSDNFFIGGKPKEKIDPRLIADEINLVESEIKAKLKASGIKAYKREMDSKINKLKESFPIDLHTILKVLSGKDQLLPLLLIRIKKLDSTHGSTTNDQMKRILAERFDLSTLNFLIEKIIKIAN